MPFGFDGEVRNEGTSLLAPSRLRVWTVSSSPTRTCRRWSTERSPGGFHRRHERLCCRGKDGAGTPADFCSLCLLILSGVPANIRVFLVRLETYTCVVHTEVEEAYQGSRAPSHNGACSHHLSVSKQQCGQ